MSRFRVFIENTAKAEVEDLPGHVRQRVKRAITDLGVEPRPHNSRPLTAPADIPLELRRVRIDHWRVVYAIDFDEEAVAVYAVRRRPPYNYEDLKDLITEEE